VPLLLLFRALPGVGYVTPWQDSNFTMALASTYIANIFGGIAFFTLCLALCCPISQSRTKALSCCFFTACLFQGFTLLIFQSNVCQKGYFAAYFPTVDTDVIGVKSVSCSLDTGSNLAISATVFYFLCIFAVFKAVLPKPLRVGGSWDDDLGDEETAGRQEPAAEEDGVKAATEEQPVEASDEKDA
jgi:hypothetical protein